MVPPLQSSSEMTSSSRRFPRTYERLPPYVASVFVWRKKGVHFFYVLLLYLTPLRFARPRSMADEKLHVFAWLVANRRWQHFMSQQRKKIRTRKRFIDHHSIKDKETNESSRVQWNMPDVC